MHGVVRQMVVEAVGTMVEVALHTKLTLLWSSGVPQVCSFFLWQLFGLRYS
jgi:hypothetical protein